MFKSELPADAQPSVLRKDGLEYGFIGRLWGLKYDYRPDITARAPMEANFHAKCDTLIAVETQMLEALKRHKRGLMQQLFPDTEAAEG